MSECHNCDIFRIVCLWNNGSSALQATWGRAAGLCQLVLFLQGAWAAWYNTGLLIKLTPKGVVFSLLFFQGAWTCLYAALCISCSLHNALPYAMQSEHFATALSVTVVAIEKAAASMVAVLPCLRTARNLLPMSGQLRTSTSAFLGACNNQVVSLAELCPTECVLHLQVCLE